MEDYKVANVKKYAVTQEYSKFAVHPSKIVGIDSFRRHYKEIASSNERILDIGGGSGIWTALLREEGISIETFALDVSLSILKERQSLDVCIVGDMENLPFHNERFDRTFFFASLHHVRNTRKALAEAIRVLRIGGHLVLHEPISLRLMILNRDIDAVDGAEFCFSIFYLFRLLRTLGMRIQYVFYRGVFQRICPWKNNITLYRICDKLDEFLQATPLFRKLGILGNKVIIVAQKQGDTGQFTS